MHGMPLIDVFVMLILDSVNVQHGLDGKRQASAFGTGRGCMLGNQRHQFGPRHHQIHLVQELALARPATAFRRVDSLYVRLA